MNAITYVAGRAMRLGKQGQECPKILLEFGGQSLLERHVALLSRLHIPKLYVVTGYLRERIVKVFPDLQTRYGVELVEMFNPDFTEGSVLSMNASLPALEKVTDGVLIMDGDVLYDLRILKQLVQSPHRSALLVDRTFSKADDDPVLVPLRNGKPFEFLKRWQGEADSVGESIGFFKVDAADLPLLIQETQMRATGQRRTESYDEILRALVKAGRFGAEDVTGIPWTEIDFPADIEYGREAIFPKLEPV